MAQFCRHQICIMFFKDDSGFVGTPGFHFHEITSPYRKYDVARECRPGVRNKDYGIVVFRIHEYVHVELAIDETSAGICE